MSAAFAWYARFSVSAISIRAMPLRRCSGATATFNTCTSSCTSQKMRKATIRSLPFPGALVRGSSATRMVLQSCSSSRRKSSGDQGCRKAARSITITSSRSAAVMRRISSLGRARTATLLLRRHGALAIERVQHAHRRAAPQVGQELAEQALILLLPQLGADLVALRRGQLPATQGVVELALAHLRGELEAVVKVAGDAELTGEDGADLVVGELQRARERVVLRAREEAPPQARQQRLDLSRLEVEELQPLHLGKDDALLDGLAQRCREQAAIERRAGGRGPLRLDQPDARLGGHLGEGDGMGLHHRHHLVE